MPTKENTVYSILAPYYNSCHGYSPFQLPIVLPASLDAPQGSERKFSHVLYSTSGYRPSLTLDELITIQVWWENDGSHSRQMWELPEASVCTSRLGLRKELCQESRAESYEPKNKIKSGSTRNARERDWISKSFFSLQKTRYNKTVSLM